MSFTIDDLSQESCYRRRTPHAAPANKDPTRVGPPCATDFTAGLAPCPAPTNRGAAGPRDAYYRRRPAGGGVGGRAHFANYHQLLNRAICSARQASRLLLGLLITCLVPPGAPMVLG